MDRSGGCVGARELQFSKWAWALDVVVLHIYTICHLTFKRSFFGYYKYMVELNGITSVDMTQRAGKEDKKAAVTSARNTSFMSSMVVQVFLACPIWASEM